MWSDLVPVLICELLFLFCKAEHVKAHCKVCCPSETSSGRTLLELLNIIVGFDELLNHAVILTQGILSLLHCDSLSCLALQRGCWTYICDTWEKNWLGFFITCQLLCICLGLWQTRLQLAVNYHCAREHSWLAEQWFHPFVATSNLFTLKMIDGLQIQTADHAFPLMQPQNVSAHWWSVGIRL